MPQNNIQGQSAQPEDKKGFSNPEIMAIEADRHDPSTWNVIRLLRDGNYWHANEWSGWLMGVVIPNEMKRRYPTEERVPPQAIKKYAKNISGEYIFVGCQEKSFDKYIPKEMQVSFRPVDNLRIDIAIEMPSDLGELSFERLNKMFLEWKSSVPVSKDDKQSGKGGSVGRNAVLPSDIPPGLMSILTKILSFPLASRTPMQAHEFVADLQKDVLSHL